MTGRTVHPSSARGSASPHFAYRVLEGNFKATVRITSRIDPIGEAAWGGHGLMARSSCDSLSRYSTVWTRLASPGESVDPPVHAFDRRRPYDRPQPAPPGFLESLEGFDPAADPRTNRRPEWMRLIRHGATIRSYLAFDDGAGNPLEWGLLGMDRDPDRPRTLLVGMAFTTGTGFTEDEAGITFDSVSFEPYLVMRPGDFNADGALDLSDPVSFLGFLFLGGAGPPCAGGDVDHPANVAVIDFNGDGLVDVTDAVGALEWLFLGGAPHVLGTGCVELEDCPNVCPDS